MSPSVMSTSDRDEAKRLLVMLTLAAMLCHIAGGDGRGVFTITHDPTGDRLDRGH